VGNNLADDGNTHIVNGYNIFITAPTTVFSDTINDNATLAIVPGNGSGAAQITTVLNVPLVINTGSGGLTIDGYTTIGSSFTSPSLAMVTQTQSTVGSAGGASSLPATPLGYWQIDMNGTLVVVPYYKQS